MLTPDSASQSTEDLLALYGCTEPLPARQALRAGPLSCEWVGGRLGPVHVHGHEVWHGLAFLFRDSGWGTPEPVFDRIHHTADGDAFVLQLNGYVPCDPLDVLGGGAADARLLLRIRIAGHADGSLHLQAEATPTHDLLTNRCGWTVLYPLSLQGRPIEALHVDGRSSRSTLPVEVPAWPPMTAVQTLRHEYAPGCWAEAVVPGEDYELEDQRNNADASFKLYSRSNFMPRPYLLHKGQTRVRDVHLRLLGEAPPRRIAPAAEPLARKPDPQFARKGPRLGVVIEPAMTRSLLAPARAALARWRPAFLHLTLWAPAAFDQVDLPGLKALLDTARAPLRLDLCGFEGLGRGGPHETVCRHMAERLSSAGVQPQIVAALPCGRQAAAWLRHCFGAATLGGGTPHFFAQLNRLEVSGGEDFMGFTVCPIVHSAEDDSVMAGLQSLPSMLATARQRHPGRAWHIGPSSLSARASPFGRQPAVQEQRRVAMAPVDARMRGLFGAAWLLGHLAGAVYAGADALTLPFPHDPSALLPRDTPATALLDVCLNWTSTAPVQWEASGESPAALAGWPLAALAGEGPEGLQVLAANLSAQTRRLRWPHGGRHACLDAASWRHRSDSDGPWGPVRPCASELVLAPYALARIDLGAPTRGHHAS